MTSVFSRAPAGMKVDVPDRPRAIVYAPTSELPIVNEALEGRWEITLTQDIAALENVDGRTRLALIDDRLPGSVIDAAKLVLGRIPHAQVVLAVGTSGIGEVLRAGLERVRVTWLFRPLSAAALAAELHDLDLDQTSASTGADRRAFPRAALEEPAVVAPAGVDLRDLSPGGALMVAPPGWTVGSHVQLDLRLTSGAPVQRVVGGIIRVEPSALGREAVVTRFVEPTARFQSLVRG